MTYNEIRKTKLLRITLFQTKVKINLKNTINREMYLEERMDSWFYEENSWVQSLMKKIRGFMKNRVYKEANLWPSKLVQEYGSRFVGLCREFEEQQEKESKFVS